MPVQFQTAVPTPVLKERILVNGKDYGYIELKDDLAPSNKYMAIVELDVHDLFKRSVYGHAEDKVTAIRNAMAKGLDDSHALIHAIEMLQAELDTPAGTTPKDYTGGE